MAETKQLSFELTELAVALIKHQGIHDGSWIVGFEFNLAAANIGPTPEEVKPAAIVQVSKAVLMRQEPGHPISLVVDAKKVNPMPQRKPVTKGPK